MIKITKCRFSCIFIVFLFVNDCNAHPHPTETTSNINLQSTTTTTDSTTKTPVLTTTAEKTTDSTTTTPVPVTTAEKTTDSTTTTPVPITTPSHTTSAQSTTTSADSTATTPSPTIISEETVLPTQINPTSPSSATVPLLQTFSNQIPSPHTRQYIQELLKTQDIQKHIPYAVGNIKINEEQERERISCILTILISSDNITTNILNDVRDGISMITHIDRGYINVFVDDMTSSRRLLLSYNSSTTDLLITILLSEKSNNVQEYAVFNMLLIFISFYLCFIVTLSCICVKYKNITDRNDSLSNIDALHVPNENINTHVSPYIPYDTQMNTPHILYEYTTGIHTPDAHIHNLNTYVPNIIYEYTNIDIIPCDPVYIPYPGGVRNTSYIYPMIPNRLYNNINTLDAAYNATYPPQPTYHIENREPVMFYCPVYNNIYDNELAL